MEHSKYGPNANRKQLQAEFTVKLYKKSVTLVHSVAYCIPFVLCCSQQGKVEVGEYRIKFFSWTKAERSEKKIRKSSNNEAYFGHYIWKTMPSVLYSTVRFRYWSTSLNTKLQVKDDKEIKGPKGQKSPSEGVWCDVVWCGDVMCDVVWDRRS